MAKAEINFDAVSVLYVRVNKEKKRGKAPARHLEGPGLIPGP